MLSQRMMIKNEKALLLILVGVYILLRILYLWQYNQSLYWGDLTVDARFHYNWARAVAEGSIIGEEVFFRAPLYPYLLAVWHYLFSGNLLVIIIIQNFIGIGSFVITYYLARKLYNPIIALITAVLYLFVFDFIFFESELLLDFLLVFFLPLFFLLVFKAEKSDRDYLWLISGIVLGMAAMTRPTVLVLAVIVPIYIFISHRDTLFKRNLRRILFNLTGVALVLLPVAARNAHVGGHFNPLPTQGGINFFIGNNPEATGWSAAMPEPLGKDWQYADCKYLAEKDMNRILDPQEVSSYWFEKGLDFWHQNPGQAVNLTVKKIWLLIADRDISNNRNISQFRSQIGVSRIFIVSLWLLVPFGVLGAVYSLKDNRKTALIVAFIISYSAVIVLFFVTSRFRLPLLPFAAILAGYGIHQFIALIRSRKTASILICSALLIILFALTQYLPYGIDFSNPHQELYSQANRLLSNGHHDRARQIYRELLELDPHYPQAHLNLATSFVRTGQLDSAAVYYRTEIEYNPASALARSSLAEVERLRGNKETAFQLAEEALSLKPYFTEVIINYIKAARAVGRQSQALARVDSIEHYYPDSPYYYFYRAVLKIDLATIPGTDLRSARDDLVVARRLLAPGRQPTYERDPLHTETLYSAEEKDKLKAQVEANLGLIAMRGAEYSDAYDHFSSALEADSTMFRAQAGLIESSLMSGNYRQALDDLDKLNYSSGDNQRVLMLMYKAQAYYGMNRFGDAIEMLEEILRIDPGYQPAVNILKKIRQED